MNRVSSFVLCVIAVALTFSSAINRTQAQAVQPSTPPQAEAQKPATPPSDEEKEDGEDDNIFTPEPAPALPAGMAGSDANDPRDKLAPGLYNAGEAAMGI